MPMTRGRRVITLRSFRIDLRRYRQAIFWCVPFTQTLARAQLVRS